MSQVVTLAGAPHVLWQCKTCGVLATCPEVVYDQHRAEGGFHFCPNGHSWGWSKENCEREELRRERDRLKQQVAARDDEVARQIAMRKQIEGKLGRVTKRINHGVCPCCNRTFGNLARHMKSKHPNVVPLEQKTA